MDIGTLFGRKQLPPFRHKFSVPAIPAGSLIVYDEENTLRHYRKFIPFTFLFVQNMSSVGIYVTCDYNQNNQMDIPSKGNQTFSSVPFRSFSIENQSSETAILSGEIDVWVEHI